MEQTNSSIVDKNKNCPCGTGKSYKDCCAGPHQNISNALTSEDLMRSRYTAFVLGMGNYLIDSQHSMTRSHLNKKELEEWAGSLRWLRLEILDTAKGTIKDHEGEVEFKAYFKHKGKQEVLHERSKFLKEYGNWLYFDKM